MHPLHNETGSPKIQIQADGKNAATLVISPLPSGYGMTLGNALRRVLLSSLPGTAVTAIKIDGVSHEYTTVPGLKDSVLDITLNLRTLRLKKHSKGVEEVEVPFKKDGPITAADLRVSSDIEILEPSQLITTCSGASPKGKMVLRIEKNVGYNLVSNLQNADEENPEFVLMDANFSPVTLVQYEVSPTRFGDQTNLDRLSLRVETSGAIEAENAIKLAAGMLESYFQLINNEEAYSDEDFTTSFEKLKQQRQSEIAEMSASPASEMAFTPIDILGLSQRTLNALVNGGITSVEQLIQTPMSQLNQFRGFGSKAKNELEQVLSQRGYGLESPQEIDEETAESPESESEAELEPEK